MATQNSTKNSGMTTAGDIIYGGTSGTPTRLAKGTAGQVLAMNSGATAPEWADASGGGISASKLHFRLFEVLPNNWSNSVAGTQSITISSGMIKFSQASDADGTDRESYGVLSSEITNMSNFLNAVADFDGSFLLADISTVVSVSVNGYFRLSLLNSGVRSDMTDENKPGVAVKHQYVANTTTVYNDDVILVTGDGAASTATTASGVTPNTSGPVIVRVKRVSGVYLLYVNGVLKATHDGSSNIPDDSDIKMVGGFYMKNRWSKALDIRLRDTQIDFEEAA